MKRVINWILNVLIIVVVLLLAYLLYENYQMKKIESENTKVALSEYEPYTCENEVITSSTKNDIITNESAKANDVVGYIAFPSLGVESAILQGDLNDSQSEAMDRGVSHDPRSTMPGEIGNTVIAGHRELFFKHFLELEKGDPVLINIGDNIFLYEIESSEVIYPDQVDTVFYDNDEDLLVMYTCYPIEAWKPYNQRVVVKAKPVEQITVDNC